MRCYFSSTFQAVTPSPLTKLQLTDFFSHTHPTVHGKKGELAFFPHFPSVSVVLVTQISTKSCEHNNFPYYRIKQIIFF